jgi:Putative peptidoglycan binding domain
MSEIHTVEPGEYMETIAEKFGFRDYHIIYDHPNNKDFKALRPNPHILFPGDKVFIPDIDPGQQAAGTDAKHKFVLKAHKIKLILRIRHAGKPLANHAYKLKIGTRIFTGKTAADGLIQHEVPVGAQDAELTFGHPIPLTVARSYTRNLNLGFLHPITTPSGVQMRLNNLGFGCGAPTGAESYAYTAALTAFQKKQQLNPTGKADNATIDKLRSEYEQGIPS